MACQYFAMKKRKGILADKCVPEEVHPTSVSHASHAAPKHSVPETSLRFVFSLKNKRKQ
jgi:hypothetical protein